MGELRIDLLEERIERLRERTDYLRDEFDGVRQRTRRLRKEDRTATGGSPKTSTRQRTVERRRSTLSSNGPDRTTRGATDEEVAAAVRRVERELEGDAGVEIPIDGGTVGDDDTASDDGSEDRDRTEIIVA